MDISKHIRRLLVALCAACCLLACAAPQPALAAWNTQTRPLLMIVVGFDGGDSEQPVPYSDAYDWHTATFEGPGSLAGYYDNMSGGRLLFVPALESCAYDGRSVTNESDRANDGIVHLTLHEPYRAWGLVNDDEDIAYEFSGMVARAFEAAGAYVNCSDYDENGDGVILPDELVVVVLIPGYDASTLADPGRTDLPVMWPHTGLITRKPPEAATADVQLDSYIALTENLLVEDGDYREIQQEPLGILYHEIGHYLGLPDLYPLNAEARDQTWGAYRVSALSLMDEGGLSADPGMLDAWSRYVLGWNVPYIAAEDGDYLVSSWESSGGYRSLLVPTSDPEQYFLIENRQPEGRDSAIATSYARGNPRGGIVVWHIDKRVYKHYALQNQVNNTDHRPGVMPLFFERDASGAYAAYWGETYPDIDEPFFDAISLENAFGDAGIALELPLYSNKRDAPYARKLSGIRLQVLSESGRDMTVRLQFPDTTIGYSDVAYQPEQPSPGTWAPNAKLAGFACAALMEETDAEITIVDDDSICGGIPQGPVSLADAEGVLSSSAPIALFNATGRQILELANANRAQAAAAAAAAGGSGEDATVAPVSTLYFAGLRFVIDPTAAAGEQVVGATVGSEAIEPDRFYRIALTQSVVDSHSLRGRWNRNALEVYGSPADAMRSFLQSDDWERSAKTAAERDGHGGSQAWEDVPPNALQDGSLYIEEDPLAESSGTSEPATFADALRSGSIAEIVAFLISTASLPIIAGIALIVLAGAIFTLFDRK